jgi:hypothetical protein
MELRINGASDLVRVDISTSDVKVATNNPPPLTPPASTPTAILAADSLREFEKLALDGTRLSDQIRLELSFNACAAGAQSVLAYPCEAGDCLC